MKKGEIYKLTEAKEAGWVNSHRRWEEGGTETSAGVGVPRSERSELWGFPWDGSVPPCPQNFHLDEPAVLRYNIR